MNRTAPCSLLVTGLLAWLMSLAAGAWAAGVTVITHGFNGTVTEWVIPMAGKMAGDPRLPGAGSSCYEFYVTNTPGGLQVVPNFIGGVAPLAADSGEIFIKFNWAAFSTGSYSTPQMAALLAPALLSTNFLPELGGRALVELPVHLVGHSRGASVMSEVTRLLGAQGVWVDHMTSLDPRPVSLFGDPAVRSYANVLFADNFWQNLGDGLTVPNGQSLAGAYNRQLTNLSGGYSSSHSDSHLWYHGTIDLATPATDTQATITSAERSAWWLPPEAAGASNGFFLSLIGRGDRLSLAEPAGAGRGRIRDGFNQQWDLGAGVAANRTALPTNNGAWPNLIRCEVSGTNAPSVDQPVPVRVHVQFGAAGSNATVQLFLDPDANPWNGNAALVAETSLPATGTGAVVSNTVTCLLNPAVIPPGTNYLAARIAGNGRVRWLYAPQRLTLRPSGAAPWLVPLELTNGTFRVAVQGFTGQTVVVDRSTNLLDWAAFRTNTLPGLQWLLDDAGAGAAFRQFYRARLAP